MQTQEEIRQELRDGSYLAVCPRCLFANDMDHNTQTSRTCAECGLKFQVDADKSDPYKLLHGGMGFTKNLSVVNALKRYQDYKARQKADAEAKAKAEADQIEESERAARLESFKVELAEAEQRGKQKRYAEKENPLIKNAQERAKTSS